MPPIGLKTTSLSSLPLGCVPLRPLFEPCKFSFFTTSETFSGSVASFDTGCVLCHVYHVKTISLTETAYHRLLAWKEGKTFSEVIEEMVPRKGTLEAAIVASRALPRMADKDFTGLEAVVNATRKKLPAPWN